MTWPTVSSLVWFFLSSITTWLFVSLSLTNISINPISKHITYNNSKSSNINIFDGYFDYLKSIQFYLPENQDEIENGLLAEISKVLGGEEEKIKVNLYNDEVYEIAVDLLLDLNSYYKILNY